MNNKIEMTIKMQVTVAQALALQAMFEYWNYLSNIGASRMISFYVDGDGSFHPNSTFSFSEKIPELTKEIKEMSVITDNGNKSLGFDFDKISAFLDKD